MASQAFELVGKALIPVAVFAALAVFRKYLPARPQKELPTASGEDMDGQLATMGRLATLAMIFVGIALGWSLHFCLASLNEILARSNGPADYYFYPEPAIWWFFPGFAALTLSWEITLQAWSLFGDRRRVELYSDRVNNSGSMWGGKGRYAGMDSRRALRWMALLIVLPIGIFTILGLPMHSALMDDGVRECGYALKGCRIESYASAKHLSAVRGFYNSHGKFIQRAGLAVDFSDGHRWSSVDSGFHRKTLDPALEQFLAAKTRLPVDRIETLRDVCPPR